MKILQKSGSTVMYTIVLAIIGIGIASFIGTSRVEVIGIYLAFQSVSIPLCMAIGQEKEKEFDTNNTHYMIIEEQSPSELEESIKSKSGELKDDKKKVMDVKISFYSNKYIALITYVE